MDRMLYVAMNGAKEILLAQAANAHNLANVNTTGFRADLTAFRSLPVYGPGLPTRVYAETGPQDTDLSQGALSTTGRPLDVAIRGPGWIAVQAPDGKEAYTRAGDLRVSSSGMLETGAGHPVLGNGGVITIPPAQQIELGSDGTISIVPIGQTPETLAVLDRIKLVDPAADSLMKGDDGLVRLKQGDTAIADGSIKLAPGVLESSNVKAVEAMVNMIELARRYEMQVRILHEAQLNDTASAKLMSIA